MAGGCDEDGQQAELCFEHVCETFFDVELDWFVRSALSFEKSILGYFVIHLIGELPSCGGPVDLIRCQIHEHILGKIALAMGNKVPCFPYHVRDSHCRVRH